METVLTSEAEKPKAGGNTDPGGLALLLGCGFSSGKQLPH